jgi:uroporphyrin-III C-methyltransferase/precorrin-2 dehydrogenase/sirohydrochlorin ferrochelatase
MTRSMTMTGFVSLVGAGPGDPELLTLRALRRLEAADLVLYDGLVDPDVVAIASRAQRFSVGKRAGRRSVEQHTINHLMVRGAQRGKRVVRLKSGDPFVLGRGGEEAQALSAAGVPFEVIPGVTSAVAAPGLAGIPVTHRGLASGFLVLSGHAATAYGPLVDGLGPNSMTIVILMGLSSRAEIAARLITRGWRPDTPVAVILAAGSRHMNTWVGRLDQLGDVELDAEASSPGTIVVGDVVGLRPSRDRQGAAGTTAEATVLDGLVREYGR